MAKTSINKTNAEVLNQIRNTATSQYKELVPEVATVEDMQTVYEVLTDYPTVKNEFMTALTNKVVKSLFYNKYYENPWKLFHKGEMPFGANIEQLFVGQVKRVSFGGHFENKQGVSNTTDEQDLLAQAQQDLRARYIGKNFANKYKITISEDQLRTAFLNQDGLSSLVNEMISELYSSANFDEFEDMKKIFVNAIESGKDFNGNVYEKEVNSCKGQTIPELQAPATVEGDYSDIRKLVRDVKATVGKMKFKTDKYNMAKVKVHSNPDELVFITTPEILADIDVNMFAQAFNVSYAEVPTRVIEVDELPSKVCTTIGEDGEEKEVYGILVDKNFVQVYDTLVRMKDFDNANGLYTNMFLHKQGIMNTCLFSNMVVFTKK